MNDPAALRIAINLMHVPSRVRLVRSDPLPDGVQMLLRIAAGDEEATNEAVELAGHPRAVVREAATFFIEQILLWPGADSYRVLGASREATSGELRRNMALLLRWLHPDLDRQGQRSVFVRRVTLAWDDLKTQERRAAYDQSRRTLSAKKPPPRKKGSARARWVKLPANMRATNSTSYGRRLGSGRIPGMLCTGERSGFLHRALLFLLGAVRH